MAVCEEKKEILWQALEAGASIQDACILSGISRAQFYKMKMKKEIDERYRLAMVKCKMRAITIIQNAAPTTWQAAAWWLERKHSNEYSLKTKVDQKTEITNKNPKEITVTFVSPPKAKP
jgi:hypothetical protein